MVKLPFQLVSTVCQIAMPGSRLHSSIRAHNKIYFTKYKMFFWQPHTSICLLKPATNTQRQLKITDGSANTNQCSNAKNRWKDVSKYHKVPVQNKLKELTNWYTARTTCNTAQRDKKQFQFHAVFIQHLYFSHIEVG
jgi:hypothetical protein